jgi:hypothetical protein
MVDERSFIIIDTIIGSSTIPNAMLYDYKILKL